MRRFTSFLMMVLLFAISSTVKAQSYEYGKEITSIDEIKDGLPFIMAKGDQFMCFPDAQNASMKDLAGASSSHAFFFKLEAPQPIGDKAVPEEIADKYIIRVLDKNKGYYSFWGADNSWLNSAGWITFSMTIKEQYGQDKLYGGVWDLQYVEGEGWTLYNIGFGGYVNNAGGTNETAEYWTLYKAEVDPNDPVTLSMLSNKVATANNLKVSTMGSTALNNLETAISAANEATEETVENLYNQIVEAIHSAETSIAFYEAVKPFVEAMEALDESGKARLEENAECQSVIDAFHNNSLDETKDIVNSIKADVYAAVKAQSAGASMTFAIINPSFETGTLEGWTSTDGGNVATNYNFDQRTGEKFVERWTSSDNGGKLSDGSLLQTLTGMPNGKYTLTAEMQNKEQGNGDAPGTGFYLVANDDKTAVAAHGETVTVSTVVTDNTLTIGTKLIECSGNWVCEDNFQLTYNGPVESTTYAITIAEDIENGTITTDVAEAKEGATVTITATPAEGYKLESISVMNGETPVEVTAENTFVMPAAAVAISAIFAAEAINPEPEPETPTFTATLVHTASSTRGSDATITNTVDAEREHVNQTNFNNVWAASAYAEFSLADLPKGATITKATLSYTGIGSGKNRDTDVLYVNAGETIDYEGMPASSEGVALDATKIETVTFPANATTPFTCDVTEALKATLASQNYIIIKWTNNVGGGDIAGKASENAPQLVVEYLPGAPEIANASFEADGEKTTGNSPLTLTGWTFDGVGSEYNDTQLLPANSESKSQFGSSDPSDGEYSLFFRYGWNGGGNVVTITSDALTEIPAGDYTLSVDYKQHYAYDEDNQQNENTKVGIALVNGEETISSEESPAAAATKGATKNTYFNETEWSTLTASFTADKAIAAGAKVVITLYAAGARRSDFFLDNVQLIKVPGIELALIDLNKAIENAKAEEAKYTVGDGLFQYPAAQIEPLTTAITAAENAYAAAESKEAVVAATTALNNALASFAPVATLPAADKQYTLSLQTTDEASPFELNIATDKISIETAGTPVTFVAQEDGTYALSNGTEYVVYKGGNDTWSLTASAEVYGWAIAAIEGGYTITGKNGFLGTNTKDGATAGSTCYGDKKTSNGFYIWTISDYAAPVEPTTYAITIAESIENGAIVTEPADEAEEGATVTITATPAEGYKLESISVKNGEEDVEVSAENTFVMPAAPVTVSATFVEDAVEPDPNLIEIAQTVDADQNMACTKTESDEYTQYDFAGGISVAFKMLNVDVKDCDYVIIKFAEPTPAGLSASFFNGIDNESIPEGVTEWKNVIADNTAVVDDVMPQIALLTINTGEGKSVKVEGVYKHKVASEPDPTTYAITIAESIENGAITTDVAKAEEGATVTITATPAEGYKLESISVKNGEEDVEVSAENTFVMPAAPVTVSATFVEDTVEPTPELPEIAQEFTSIEELAGKSFAIINKETGKMLYGTNDQNLGYDNGDAAINETNTGYYFKLDTPAEDAEDATIANCHLLRLITPAGAEYNIWGNPGYLNTQPTTGNCSFILGLNNQNGQDIKNGAVWDIQYVEGKGFTLLNKGTGLYLNDNLPAKYEEPVYWTFCTFPEEPSAEIANMTLSVKEGATVDPEDGTFPVTFGYTATVTPEDLALPEGILTYTVTPEGGEAQEFETDIQLDVNERNIYIKDFDKDVERYTITIKSVRFHYIDIETFEYVDIATIPVENLSIVIENPVSVNGINAAAKSNRKVVENGRVVIYKNGVKTMSSGVSIR